jgi:hypothetical protein
VTQFQYHPLPQQVSLSTTASRLGVALAGLPDNGYRAASATWTNTEGRLMTLTLTSTPEEPPPVADENEESD